MCCYAFAGIFPPDEGARLRGLLAVFRLLATGEKKLRSRSPRQGCCWLIQATVRALQNRLSECCATPNSETRCASAVWRPTRNTSRGTPSRNDYYLLWEMPPLNFPMRTQLFGKLSGGIRSEEHTSELQSLAYL